MKYSKLNLINLKNGDTTWVVLYSEYNLIICITIMYGASKIYIIDNKLLSYYNWGLILVYVHCNII